MSKAGAAQPKGRRLRFRRAELDIFRPWPAIPGMLAGVAALLHRVRATVRLDRRRLSGERGIVDGLGVKHRARFAVALF